VIQEVKPLGKRQGRRIQRLNSQQQEAKILTSDTRMTKSSKPTALTNLHRTISLKITTAVASVVVMMVGVRASQRRFGFSWCAFVVILNQRSKVVISVPMDSN
jgi:DhnA family fructose-bisphosphate aldolase class Ia